ncbi:MAG: dihydropteroate synthase [Clostridia bacterium]|nr:dihydropteroate synthase [Clostridia bacterium]
MFSFGGYSLPLGKKTYVMGILNYTPDSFSDGGEFFSPETALGRALEMEKQGADIIDVGANSTRPGSEILGAADELARLEQVLGALKNKVSAPLSVDTFYPECACFALENGALIINDVSGKYNEEIASLVKKNNAAYIVTHNPCGADKSAEYPDGAPVEVRKFFLECIEKSADTGLGFSHLCLDPGFGFGKSRQDDFEILRDLRLLKFGGVALLAGLSRKRMTSPFDGSIPADRDITTSAANAVAIANGADIIRVHNVPYAVQTAAIADKIRI